MRLDINQQAFFELLRVGLFPVRDDGVMVVDSIFKDVDWKLVYQLAREQSVQGLVLQGTEVVQRSWLKAYGSPLVPKALLLQWIGEVQVIEKRNKEMNVFISELIEQLRKENIHAILVKGQGIAQCYERPLWRCSGDIDLYLDEDDFQKAKKFFRPLVNKFDPDDEYTRHINMHYREWTVEIHANQHCALSQQINRILDDVHRDLFYRGKIRNWINNKTRILLPSADNDALIIFTHFFNHFYKGGVGLRQICDWCRLLWIYRDTLDLGLLEKRIRESGLLDEWRTFGAFAVKYLCMPIEAMPFLDYNLNSNLKKKANMICKFIMEVGNFGHNRDTSYYGKYPFLIRKTISLGYRCADFIHHARIFPMDTLRFFPYMMFNGVRNAMKGE